MGKSKKPARGDKTRAGGDSVFHKVRGQLKSFKKLQRELRKAQKKKGKEEKE